MPNSGPSPAGRRQRNILSSILFLVIGTLSASYLTTQTFDFNGLSNKLLVAYRKYYGTPKELNVFTVEELAQYDGSDPEKPIYLSLMGKVFDVSAGGKYYAKGGSYGYFSGKDASRAYVTGCFETHLTHDLRGLTEKELKDLQGWVDFYEKSDKYFLVGTLDMPAIDPESPIPEMCKQG